jgi:hypothetical protein
MSADGTPDFGNWTDEELAQLDKRGPSHNGRGLGPSDVEAARTELKKRGPGRPPLPPGTKHSTGNPLIQVRCEPDLAAFIQARGGPAFLRGLAEAARAKSEAPPRDRFPSSAPRAE